MDLHQSTQCTQLLYPLLQQQLKLVKEFLLYLDEIKLAISQNQKEQLQELLEQPALDVFGIEQHQLAQHQVLADFGFESSTQGLDDCINACQQDSLSALYRDLKQQLQQLQNSLMINDLLIKKNQQRVRQSIRLLSGHEIKNASTTYSSTGNTSDNSLDRHSLARA